MHNELFNLMRVTLLILAIINFVIMCITDEPRKYPKHAETTIPTAEYKAP